MIYLVLLLVCVLSSFALESCARVGNLGNRCYLNIGSLIHALVITIGYSLLFLITQRPVLSAGLCLFTVAVIIVVNNAKYAALREPLTFTDFFLYGQAIRHPRLYLPFVGILPLLIVVLGGVLSIVFCMILEARYLDIFSLMSLILLLLSIFLFYLVSRFSRRVQVSGQLTDDCQRYGLISTLCIYFFNASDSRELVKKELTNSRQHYEELIGLDISKDKFGKDLVVVQSESFFDARRLDANIKREILSNYDQCKDSCDAHGLLNVPAWGANTMRTEFGFLTSLRSDQIGLASYYPYRQLLSLKVPSIVGYLKSKGYHCVCIHPHAASFFMRDKFFQQLGFDEFIDDKQFAGEKREGPYTADSAVTTKIQEVLDRPDLSKPCFVFAITMENHGPLHLESLHNREWAEYYEQHPPEGVDELTVYLRHLKSADKMISNLCDYLCDRDRHAVFSFYGDHVPAISSVFKRLNYEDARTDYFIWSSGRNNIKRKEKLIKELDVENLGVYLIRLLCDV